MALFTSIGAALGASTVVAAGATTSAAFATGVGAVALAGGAYGLSAMNSDAQMKQAKRAASAMGDMNMQMPEMPKMEDAAAKAKARTTDRKRAAARSDSVMTNPLGLKEEAATARKTLLGG